MTNDTSTLNGALQELGETMASNLQAKGVTASASDGLTTLAGKILTIPAGSCYHIEFSEDSYTAVGGSATLEIYLQENYQPKVGATVTVTGSDSSLYTGITNSSGTASVTVSNISSETTFTASYSGATATCTVTYEPFGFEDDFSSGLSNKWVTFGATPSTSVSGGVLTLSKNGNRGGIYYDKRITGDYKVTVSVQSGTYDTYAVGLNTTTGGWNYYELQPKYSYGYFFIDSSGNTTETHYNRQSASYSSATLVFEVTKDTSIKVYVNGTLKTTYNIQDTTTDGYVGIVQCCNRSTQINSIKVEAL